jgi:hypothetical protein
MATLDPNELRTGMQVIDANGVPLGTVKRVLTRGEVLRLPDIHPEDVPPESDFPYLEVEARGHHPTTLIYNGYYIPRSAITTVSGSDIWISGTRADLDNLGWNDKPGFLP